MLSKKVKPVLIILMIISLCTTVLLWEPYHRGFKTAPYATPDDWTCHASFRSGSPNLVTGAYITLQNQEGSHAGSLTKILLQHDTTTNVSMHSAKAGETRRINIKNRLIFKVNQTENGPLFNSTHWRYVSFNLIITIPPDWGGQDYPSDYSFMYGSTSRFNCQITNSSQE